MSLLRSFFAYTAIPCLSGTLYFSHRHFIILGNFRVGKHFWIEHVVFFARFNGMVLISATFNTLKISTFHFCSSVVKITLLSTLSMETVPFFLTTNCSWFLLLLFLLLLLLKFLKCFGVFSWFFTASMDTTSDVDCISTCTAFCLMYVILHTGKPGMINWAFCLELCQSLPISCFCQSISLIFITLSKFLYLPKITKKHIQSNLNLHGN